MGLEVGRDGRPGRARRPRRSGSWAPEPIGHRRQAPRPAVPGAAGQVEVDGEPAEAGCATRSPSRPSPRSCRGRSTARSPSRGARRLARRPARAGMVEDAARGRRSGRPGRRPRSSGGPDPRRGRSTRDRRPACRAACGRAMLSRRFATTVSRRTASTRTSGGSTGDLDRDRPRRRAPAARDRRPRRRAPARSCDLEIGRSVPEPIRLRSRTERTSRSRRSTSASMRLGRRRGPRSGVDSTPGRRGCRPSPGCWRAASGGRARRSRGARS